MVLYQLHTHLRRSASGRADAHPFTLEVRVGFYGRLGRHHEVETRPMGEDDRLLSKHGFVERRLTLIRHECHLRVGHAEGRLILLRFFLHELCHGSRPACRFHHHLHVGNILVDDSGHCAAHQVGSSSCARCIHGHDRLSCSENSG